MKNKIAWTILGILIITLLSLLWTRSIDEDSWICIDSGWIEHGKPNLPKPVAPCSKTEQELVVKKYIKENISSISPEKEVLGGTFYVDKINWVGNNSGIVEYEDGHILLRAFFNYKIQTSANGKETLVILTNFKVLK